MFNAAARPFQYALQTRGPDILVPMLRAELDWISRKAFLPALVPFGLDVNKGAHLRRLCLCWSGLRLLSNRMRS